MDALLVYPNTQKQVSVLEALLTELNIRFSMYAEKRTDDTLMSKSDYFSMLDERIKNVELGKTVEYTPELESELFAEIL